MNEPAPGPRLHVPDPAAVPVEVMLWAPDAADTGAPDRRLKAVEYHLASDRVLDVPVLQYCGEWATTEGPKPMATPKVRRLIGESTGGRPFAFSIDGAGRYLGAHVESPRGTEGGGLGVFTLTAGDATRLLLRLRAVCGWQLLVYPGALNLAGVSSEFHTLYLSQPSVGDRKAPAVTLTPADLVKILGARDANAVAVRSPHHVKRGCRPPRYGDRVVPGFEPGRPDPGPGRA